MKRLILAIFLAVFYGCTQPQKTISTPRPTIVTIETADPVQDARNAISQGDFRLAAVRGYTLMVPGTEGQDIKPEQVWVIEGTSDSGDRRMNEIAIRYAELYNKQIRNKGGS